MANNHKTPFTISLNKEKLIAVQAFLEEKSLNLEQEFEEFFETIFKKHVPRNVQIYIEKTVSSAKSTPEKKVKPTQKSVRPEEKALQDPGDTVTRKEHSEAQISSPALYTPPLPYDRFDRNKTNNSNQ